MSIPVIRDFPQVEQFRVSDIVTEADKYPDMGSAQAMISIQNTFNLIQKHSVSTDTSILAERKYYLSVELAMIRVASKTLLEKPELVKRMGGYTFDNVIKLTRILKRVALTQEIESWFLDVDGELPGKK